MKRKIIQICCGLEGSKVVWALCNDATVWWGHEKDNEYTSFWEKLSDIPQDEN